MLLFAGAVLVASCHSSPPANAPPPEPSASEIARRKQIQDSLNAVAVARADSLDRASKLAQAEKLRSDSLEAARLEAARLAQQAADQANATNESLRQELGATVYFDVARSQISDEGRAALDRKVAILDANPDVRLQISGACDERGSESYNLALGERRAGAVKKYLIAKGIAGARLDQTSTGEDSPVSDGHDEAAWAQNRRTSFVITSGNALLAMN